MVGQILKNLCKGNTTAVVFFCMERATWATLSPQRVERAHSMQLQRVPPRWGAGNLRRSCCRCRRFVPRRIVVESGGVLKVRIIGGSKVRTLTIVRPPSPLPYGRHKHWAKLGVLYHATMVLFFKILSNNMVIRCTNNIV